MRMAVHDQTIRDATRESEARPLEFHRCPTHVKLDVMPHRRYIFANDTRAPLVTGSRVSGDRRRWQVPRLPWRRTIHGLQYVLPSVCTPLGRTPFARDPRPSTCQKNGDHARLVRGATDSDGVIPRGHKCHRLPPPSLQRTRSELADSLKQ